MVSKVWQATFVVVVISCFVWKVSGIMCYECFNCETSFNSTHLKNCTKSTSCMKMVLMNGEVDRACGDKKRCAGRDPKSRRTRSINTPDENGYDGRGRRLPRGLLDSSPAAGNGPAKKEQLGAAEASSIHCCNDKECNGSPPSVTFSFTTIVFATCVPQMFRFI